MEKIGLLVLLALSLAGCKTITTCFLIELSSEPVPEDTKLLRSAEYQREIDALLAADAENKKWESIFLREVEIAEENGDQDAYRFFLEEYIKVPRLRLPEWMKKEKGYIEGGWYLRY